MNLIRTIQRTEDPAWVAKHFREGPFDEDWAPLYPFRLPFPCRLRHYLRGGFVYVVYRGEVIGYTRIAEVVEHVGRRVGTDANPVASGDEVVMDGPLKPMPFPLRCRGFTGPRYVPEDLHTLQPDAAQHAIKAATGRQGTSSGLD